MKKNSFKKRTGGKKAISISKKSNALTQNKDKYFVLISNLSKEEKDSLVTDILWTNFEWFDNHTEYWDFDIFKNEIQVRRA